MTLLCSNFGFHQIRIDLMRRSLLMFLVHRKAQPRPLSYWQLQVAKQRTGPFQWRSFSCMCAWVVHWMGMAPWPFRSLWEIVKFLFFYLIYLLELHFILVGNFENFTTMILAASSVFSCPWWYYGWFSHTQRSTMLVQSAKGVCPTVGF